MIKNKLFMLAGWALLAGIASPALALSVNANNAIKLDKATSSSVRATTTTTTTTGTTTVTTTVTTSGTGYATTTPRFGNANATRGANKSAVAIFVQNLVHVADREKGIGSEVRVIAHEQGDSASTTLTAMAEINNRNGFKTFLIGSDYKNLGVIRSELVKTDNRIAKLKVLSDRAVSVESKTALNAEIKVLESDQVKIQEFVSLNESKFSLFGWLFKSSSN